MPYFDRFDICEAYKALESDYNESGILPGRSRSVAGQLMRMQFWTGPYRRGYHSLSENGRAIYRQWVDRAGLSFSESA